LVIRTQERFLIIEPVNLIFSIDTLLGRMGWGEVAIVGDVNKIGEQEESEDQGAAAASNTSEILQQFTHHSITLSHAITVSGHPSLNPYFLSLLYTQPQECHIPFSGETEPTYGSDL
jgi:hypothetical protein